MHEQGAETPDHPTHGRMECHAQQPSTIAALPNRNTMWRCVVCSHVVNLIPGKYSAMLDDTPTGARGGSALLDVPSSSGAGGPHHAPHPHAGVSAWERARRDV